ncbi:XRE family transcriptional regulator [Sedimentitalea sp. CY04]|uniref:XRE family transcriptional regulator n=1 Tax=Parasedimentitalea denitrificans TaxID=2211118 RepID=A0ABX0WBJ8_9RHOB|nr:helix-turn-helix domain-containing protein [Sedimentitalea sp. CY04]NIZ63029.1 XRE family transcriptional regulator [Sedimentitalea sp. CY04]
MSDDTITLNLRNIRAESGLSLTKVAELTGVSKAMLGQIERGESSPTIATLWKIAKGFHLPLSALIDEATREETGKTRTAKTVQFPGSIAVKIVFPYDPNIGGETFQISLKPGQSHVSQPHETGMIEEVILLEGEMEVLREDLWVPLNVGEGIRFRADREHGYCGGPKGAVFLNMHHYRRAVLSQG